MEVLYPHCAGLDIHKESVVACVRHMAGGAVKREVRSFKTMTTDLLALSEWLSAEGCTHVLMEATGVYWKPVWHEGNRISNFLDTRIGTYPIGR